MVFNPFELFLRPPAVENSLNFPIAKTKTVQISYVVNYFFCVCTSTFVNKQSLICFIVGVVLQSKAVIG